MRIMGEVPPRGDEEFWEPRALVLLGLLESRGPLALKVIKVLMSRKGFKVGITVNLLSFLCLTHRVQYLKEEKLWEAIKS